MSKKTINRFYILLGIPAALLVAMFIALSIFNSPTYAWRLFRYGQSDIGDVGIFPERAIQNSGDISFIERGHQGTPHEVEYLTRAGEKRKEVLDDLLERTGTRAFLIVKFKVGFETDVVRAGEVAEPRFAAETCEVDTGRK